MVRADLHGINRRRLLLPGNGLFRTVDPGGSGREGAGSTDAARADERQRAKNGRARIGRQRVHRLSCSLEEAAGQGSGARGAGFSEATAGMTFGEAGGAEINGPFRDPCATDGMDSFEREIIFHVGLIDAACRYELHVGNRRTNRLEELKPSRGFPGKNFKTLRPRSRPISISEAS